MGCEAFGPVSTSLSLAVGEWFAALFNTMRTGH